MNQKVLFLSLLVVYTVADEPWIGKPLDGDRKTWWQYFHQRLLNQTAVHRADLKVIFFGDSITEFWNQEGRDIWDKYYAPRHAYNYGINGDKVEQLIWRIEHGEFDGLNAKVVVLKIGNQIEIEYILYTLFSNYKQEQITFLIIIYLMISPKE